MKDERLPQNLSISGDGVLILVLVVLVLLVVVVLVSVVLELLVVVVLVLLVVVVVVLKLFRCFFYVTGSLGRCSHNNGWIESLMNLINY